MGIDRNVTDDTVGLCGVTSSDLGSLRTLGLVAFYQFATCLLYCYHFCNCGSCHFYTIVEFIHHLITTFSYNHGCQNRVLTRKLVRVYVSRYEKPVNLHVNSIFCKLV
jgi:hypothetical protein